MQIFREKPALAIGLLVIALLALVIGWWFSTRQMNPSVEVPPVNPPPETNPSKEASPI